MEQRPFPTRISKETIREMPIGRYEGPVSIVTTLTEVETMLQELKGATILGFDTETRPSFKKGNRHQVALLQLVSANNAYLVRLNQIGLPEGIVQLLADSNVLKIGVAVHDDIKALQELAPFEAGGFVDLAHIARRLKIVTSGLRSLAGMFLGVRISKKAQMSNWECETLSDIQINYAATDAWVCREMYCYLKKEGHLSENKDSKAS